MLGARKVREALFGSACQLLANPWACLQNQHTTEFRQEIAQSGRTKPLEASLQTRSSQGKLL